MFEAGTMVGRRWGDQKRGAHLHQHLGIAQLLRVPPGASFPAACGAGGREGGLVGRLRACSLSFWCMTRYDANVVVAI